MSTLNTSSSVRQTIRANLHPYRIPVFTISPTTVQVDSFTTRDATSARIVSIDFNTDFLNVTFNDNCFRWLRKVKLSTNNLTEDNFGVNAVPVNPYFDSVSPTDEWHLCTLYITPGIYNSIDDIIAEFNKNIAESFKSLLGLSTNTSYQYTDVVSLNNDIFNPSGVLQLYDTFMPTSAFTSKRPATYFTDSYTLGEGSTIPVPPPLDYVAFRFSEASNLTNISANIINPTFTDNLFNYKIEVANKYIDTGSSLTTDELDETLHSNIVTSFTVPSDYNDPLLKPTFSFAPDMYVQTDIDESGYYLNSEITRPIINSFTSSPTRAYTVPIKSGKFVTFTEWIGLDGDTNRTAFSTERYIYRRAVNGIPTNPDLRIDLDVNIKLTDNNKYGIINDGTIRVVSYNSNRASNRYTSSMIDFSGRIYSKSLMSEIAGKSHIIPETRIVFDDNSTKPIDFPYYCITSSIYAASDVPLKTYAIPFVEVDDRGYDYDMSTSGYVGATFMMERYDSSGVVMMCNTKDPALDVFIATKTNASSVANTYINYAYELYSGDVKTFTFTPSGITPNNAYVVGYRMDHLLEIDGEQQAVKMISNNRIDKMTWTTTLDDATTKYSGGTIASFLYDTRTIIRVDVTRLPRCDANGNITNGPYRYIDLRRSGVSLSRGPNDIIGDMDEGGDEVILVNVNGGDVNGMITHTFTKENGTIDVPYQSIRLRKVITDTSTIYAHGYDCEYEIVPDYVVGKSTTYTDSTGSYEGVFERDTRRFRVRLPSQQYMNVVMMVIVCDSDGVYRLRSVVVHESSFVTLPKITNEAENEIFVTEMMNTIGTKKDNMVGVIVCDADEYGRTSYGSRDVTPIDGHSSTTFTKYIHAPDDKLLTDVFKSVDTDEFNFTKTYTTSIQNALYLPFGTKTVIGKTTAQNVIDGNDSEMMDVNEMEVFCDVVDKNVKVTTRKNRTVVYRRAKDVDGIAYEYTTVYDGEGGDDETIDGLYYRNMYGMYRRLDKVVYKDADGYAVWTISYDGTENVPQHIMTWKTFMKGYAENAAWYSVTKRVMRDDMLTHPDTIIHADGKPHMYDTFTVEGDIVRVNDDELMNVKVDRSKWKQYETTLTMKRNETQSASLTSDVFDGTWLMVATDDAAIDAVHADGAFQYERTTANMYDFTRPKWFVRVKRTRNGTNYVNPNNPTEYITVATVKGTSSVTERTFEFDVNMLVHFKGSVNEWFDGGDVKEWTVTDKHFVLTGLSMKGAWMFRKDAWPANWDVSGDESKGVIVVDYVSEREVDDPEARKVMAQCVFDDATLFVNGKFETATTMVEKAVVNNVDADMVNYPNVKKRLKTVDEWFDMGDVEVTDGNGIRAYSNGPATKGMLVYDWGEYMSGCVTGDNAVPLPVVDENGVKWTLMTSAKEGDERNLVYAPYGDEWMSNTDRVFTSWIDGEIGGDSFAPRVWTENDGDEVATKRVSVKTDSVWVNEDVGKAMKMVEMDVRWGPNEMNVNRVTEKRTLAAMMKGADGEANVKVVRTPVDDDDVVDEGMWEGEDIVKVDEDGVYEYVGIHIERATVCEWVSDKYTFSVDDPGMISDNGDVNIEPSKLTIDGSIHVNINDEWKAITAENVKSMVVWSHDDSITVQLWAEVDGEHVCWNGTMNGNMTAYAYKPSDAPDLVDIERYDVHVHMVTAKPTVNQGNWVTFSYTVTKGGDGKQTMTTTHNEEEAVTSYDVTGADITPDVYPWRETFERLNTTDHNPITVWRTSYMIRTAKTHIADSVDDPKMVHRPFMRIDFIYVDLSQAHDGGSYMIELQDEDVVYHQSGDASVLRLRDRDSVKERGRWYIKRIPLRSSSTLVPINYNLNTIQRYIRQTDFNGNHTYTPSSTGNWIRFGDYYIDIYGVEGSQTIPIIGGSSASTTVEWTNTASGYQVNEEVDTNRLYGTVFETVTDDDGNIVTSNMTDCTLQGTEYEIVEGHAVRVDTKETTLGDGIYFARDGQSVNMTSGNATVSVSSGTYTVTETTSTWVRDMTVKLWRDSICTIPIDINAYTPSNEWNMKGEPSKDPVPLSSARTINAALSDVPAGDSDSFMSYISTLDRLYNEMMNVIDNGNPSWTYYGNAPILTTGSTITPTMIEEWTNTSDVNRSIARFTWAGTGGHTYYSYHYCRGANAKGLISGVDSDSTAPYKITSEHDGSFLCNITRSVVVNSISFTYTRCTDTKIIQRSSDGSFTCKYNSADTYFAPWWTDDKCQISSVIVRQANSSSWIAKYNDIYYLKWTDSLCTGRFYDALDGSITSGESVEYVDYVDMDNPSGSDKTVMTTFNKVYTGDVNSSFLLDDRTESVTNTSISTTTIRYNDEGEAYYSMDVTRDGDVAVSYSEPPRTPTTLTVTPSPLGYFNAVTLTGPRYHTPDAPESTAKTMTAFASLTDITDLSDVLTILSSGLSPSTSTPITGQILPLTRLTPSSILASADSSLAFALTQPLSDPANDIRYFGTYRLALSDITFTYSTTITPYVLSFPESQSTITSASSYDDTTISTTPSTIIIDDTSTTPTSTTLLSSASIITARVSIPESTYLYLTKLRTIRSTYDITPATITDVSTPCTSTLPSGIYNISGIYRTFHNFNYVHLLKITVDGTPITITSNNLSDSRISHSVEPLALGNTTYAFRNIYVNHSPYLNHSYTTSMKTTPATDWGFRYDHPNRSRPHADASRITSLVEVYTCSPTGDPQAFIGVFYNMSDVSNFTQMYTSTIVNVPATNSVTVTNGKGHTYHYTQSVIDNLLTSTEVDFNRFIANISYINGELAYSLQYHVPGDIYGNISAYRFTPGVRMYLLSSVTPTFAVIHDGPLDSPDLINNFATSFYDDTSTSCASLITLFQGDSRIVSNDDDIITGITDPSKNGTMMGTMTINGNIFPTKLTFTMDEEKHGTILTFTRTVDKLELDWDGTYLLLTSTDLNERLVNEPVYLTAVDPSGTETYVVVDVNSGVTLKGESNKIFILSQSGMDDQKVMIRLMGGHPLIRHGVRFAYCPNMINPVPNVYGVNVFNDDNSMVAPNYESLSFEYDGNIFHVVTGEANVGTPIFYVLSDAVSVSDATVDKALMSTYNLKGSIEKLITVNDDNVIDTSGTISKNKELLYDEYVFAIMNDIINGESSMISNTTTFGGTKIGIDFITPIIPVTSEAVYTNTQSFLDVIERVDFNSNVNTMKMTNVVVYDKNKYAMTTDVYKLSMYNDDVNEVIDYYYNFTKDGDMWSKLGFNPCKVEINRNTLINDPTTNMYDSVANNAIVTPVYIIKGKYYSEQLYDGPLITQRPMQAITKTIINTMGMIKEKTSKYNLDIGTNVMNAVDKEQTMNVNFYKTSHYGDDAVNMDITKAIDVKVTMNEDVEMMLNENAIGNTTSIGTYSIVRPNEVPCKSIQQTIDVNKTVDIPNNSKLYVYLTGSDKRYPLANLNASLNVEYF